MKDLKQLTKSTIPENVCFPGNCYSLIHLLQSEERNLEFSVKLLHIHIVIQLKRQLTDISHVPFC